jgi:hypothetical protein
MANIYREFYEKDAAWCELIKRVIALREKIASIDETWESTFYDVTVDHCHLAKVRAGCNMALKNMERRLDLIEARIRNRVDLTHDVRAITRFAAFYAEDDDWMERQFIRDGYLRGFKF